MTLLPALRDLRARDGYQRWSKWTDEPLLILAVVFLGVLLAPILTDLSPSEQLVITIANVVIWAAFAIDYFVRLYLADDRWRYLRTHVLDLVVVVLPMLRPLRALRALRFVRVIRLGSVAALAHKRATRTLHARVTFYVVSASIASLLIAGVAVREAERGSKDANITTLADGIWWAATTVTTVGYGDRYPTTTLGRLIALALMLVGIALLGVITASIATWFVERIQGVEKEVVEAEQRTGATLEDVLAELREIRRRFEDSDVRESAESPQDVDTTPPHVNAP